MMYRLALLFCVVAVCNAFVAPFVRPLTRSSALYSVDHAAVEAAREAAQKATAEFGAASKEARLAWEDFEEIASADTSPATQPALDDECEVANSQLCEDYEAAVMEVKSFISGEKSADLITALSAENSKLKAENAELKAKLGL
mmetsp:Transcript_23183/g.33691  ORF Transcript_23183/g.33691 Transcript_23183/m.33691 type:complete len:143 (-) Transcript_23183:451-879(-)|eukprot:CAMPEP_0113941354 /NCGR_PEP_ID=MMETSP1339-20121228/7283_1 /TAXON_ID=94617 /ORGANISM="Fibrocapsa japonica" /LENGTH=142 /DNA_ID=CAMNT_0000945473 /DNA_START=100 /DNA_END=528 /DNA_ORIENTATION=+ /assembly_acc=CAM_ASM_000762